MWPQQQPEAAEPSSATTIPQCPSSAPASAKRASKLGPPQYVKPRPYPAGLELRENQMNRKLIAEYEDEIYKHFVTLEQTSKANPKMIDLQPEIEWFMRPYLLDFLIEMHSSFKLKAQTLHLCMNIIDRYCARRIVFKQHYQLIGCTAMWMAAKYEDKKSRVPTLRELSLMCRNVYDESMFKEMEMHMLSTLEWSLGHVTLEDCLQLSIRTAKALHSPPDGTASPSSSKKAVENAIIAIGRYLGELSLFHRGFLSYPTSLVAVATHLIASAIVNDHAAAQLLVRVQEDHEFESFGDFKAQYHNSSSQSAKLDHFNGIYDDDDDADLEIDANDDPDDDEMFDDDSENVKPAPKLPFICGFEGAKTTNQIRQLSLMFLNAINNPSDILVNKYTPLGVISVVDNFLQKHYTFLQHSIGALNLKNMKNIDEMIFSSSSGSQLMQLTDLMMGLSNGVPANLTIQPPHYTASGSVHSPPPLTPSSSTSQYSSSSIFSSGLKTPNGNTISIKIPGMAQSGHNSQSATASVGVSKAQHRKRIVYPNSSPVADLPNSSPPVEMSDYDDAEPTDSNTPQFAQPTKPASRYYDAYSAGAVSSPLDNHRQQQQQASQQNQSMIY